MENKKQNGRTHVQEDKQPPEKVNHKRNIKFLDPLLSQEAYQIRNRVDLLKGRLA
jgi:hypothetical protein